MGHGKWKEGQCAKGRSNEARGEACNGAMEER